MSCDNLPARLGLNLPSPLTAFTPDWPGANKVSMWIKRDDLIHPIISGNKWRKLSDVLHTFLHERPASKRHIISFGGGYSNHLHALGWCCRQLDIAFTAIVRGNYQANPTPMLTDLATWQATIRYVTKAEYHRRHDPDYLATLQQDAPGALIIPEGGSQLSALSGVRQLLAEISPHPFNTIITPVASGATMAGIVSGLAPHQSALGIAVLNGVGYLEDLVAQFLPDFSTRHQQNSMLPATQWQILHQFHHGGYARRSPALTSFCDELLKEHELAVEPVYSGKVFYAVKHLLEDGFFTPGDNIVILHTGGLQGSRSDPAGNI
ncbi:1-aminocyclopropane-1-carboxylate deaminase/D-cysteine desulfhydrase [Alteromonas gilva]|uniref:Pyridoxal-phosphate dependent enzyme n=1 Tax=Alteromonas gilva TaxID=2987522 RepID=A0ABT5L6S2_9ALTE|nr:pyridoxal-phosphate dependent enzyme [Alteromonas gilva]MDC8832573.1 pyridoxal-phosphate dependent enzyme [Alteromonas gilva]